MKRKVKRLFSFLLALSLILTMSGVSSVHAQENENGETKGNLRITSSSGGYVSLTVDGQEYWATEEQPINRELTAGEKVLIRAVPDSGYEIAEYKVQADSGEEAEIKDQLTDGNTKELEILSGETKVQVTFAETQKEKLEAEEEPEVQNPDSSGNGQTVEGEEPQEPDNGTDYSGRIPYDAEKMPVIDLNGGIMPLYVEPGSMCTLNPDLSQIYTYGTWSCCYFTVTTDSGTYTGYCGEPSTPVPSGQWPVSLVTNDRIKMALMFGENGPWYAESGALFGNPQYVYPYIHAMIGYEYCRDSAGLTDQQVLAITRALDEQMWRKETAEWNLYTAYYADNDVQDIFWLEGGGKGSLEVYKYSTDNALTRNHSCYSLAGAVYGIYTDGYGEPPIATITTSEWISDDGTVRYGWGKAENLEPRHYWVQEISPSPGFALDTNWYEATVTGGGTAASTAIVTSNEKPQRDPVNVLLTKNDQDGDPIPGAEFTVKYYSGLYDNDPAKQGQTPVRTWVLKTGDGTNGTEEGKIVLAEGNKYKVSGDAFFVDERNRIVFPVGTVTIQETKAPSGYLINEEVFVRKIVGEGNDEYVHTYNAPIITDDEQFLQIELSKLDAETNKAEEAKNASLKGAVYEVRDSADQVVDTLTTDAKGKAVSKELPLDNYTIKETKASKGYLLDEKTYTVNGSAPKDTTTRVFKYEVTSKETPQKVQIELSKIDAETNKGEAQGAATLKGAKYEIRDSADRVVDTLTTDAKGKAVSKELPLDVYTIQETAASNGYLVNPATETVDASEPKDTTARVFTYKPKMPEDIIRGNVEIIKVAENQDEDNDTLQGLQGVEFTFTSKTTGKKVLTVTTDENGFASTASKEQPRGSLVFDTYVVTETKHPAGYKPIEPFEVTISEEGVTLKGIYKEDKLIVSPVSVVKKDKGTGKVIPVKNTEFRLLDADQNPVTMTTYYPNKQVHETFKTDANGQFNFPDKLKYGIYYLEEIHAPEGYLKGGLLKFEVTEGATWENPLIIEYADENAMGTITIQKTDAETDAVLGGAVFEIVAAEDIVTPDGTVRLTKGAVADTVTTDKNGTATSKSLYLGKYKVKEKQQPQGYILSKKTYETELVYKDQNTALVTAQVNATNTPTRPELYKTDADTKEPLEGVQYKVWNKEMQADDSVDPEMAAEQICTTDKDGKISVSYLAPGTYCFQEVKALPGYAVDNKIYEITIDADGRIDGKDVGEIHATNKHVEIVKTTAIDKATETHEAVPNKTTTFVDKVEYKGLQVSKEYVLKGKLMDKATGKPLLIDEKEVTAEKTFIPEKADGEVTVEFTFDSSALLGKSVVVFESLYDEGIEAAVHADIEDKGQTVEFPKPEIGTIALDKATGTHKAVPDKKTTFVDTVKYKNLVVGQKYTVKGVLMDKATGKPLQIDGKEVTAEKTFIPEKADGEIKVEFTFDSSALIGKTTVTFEKIYVNGMEVAAHEDLEDEGQTVEFPKPTVKTTATDKESGSHEAVPNKKTTIVDKVDLTGLVTGSKYTLKGKVMDKETGKPIQAEGKEVAAEKTFTAQASNETVELEFVFDSSALSGKAIVVFEYLYANDIQLASHADIEDEGQTIQFKKASNTLTVTPQTGLKNYAALYTGIGSFLLVLALFFIWRMRRKKMNDRL